MYFTLIVILIVIIFVGAKIIEHLKNIEGAQKKQANNNVQEKPQTNVVIVNPDFYQDDGFTKQYNEYVSVARTRKKFGRIEVLIVDNEKNHQ